MKKLLLPFLLAIFLIGCEKDTTIIDSSVNSEQYKPKSLNGNQKINPNQTDEHLIRGESVSIPLFSEETVEVRAGSWITITFSIQGLVNLGACQVPLSEQQITSIMEDAEIFLEDIGFELSFDGNQLDVLTHLRADEISTVTNNDGDCWYILPFRYYVRPQSIGAHTLSTVLEGLEYSRQVIWVRGNGN